IDTGHAAAVDPARLPAGGAQLNGIAQGMPASGGGLREGRVHRRPAEKDTCVDGVERREVLANRHHVRALYPDLGRLVEVRYELDEPVRDDRERALTIVRLE